MSKNTTTARPQAARSPIPDADETARAFGSTVGEIWKSMQGLSLPLPAVNQVQSDYLAQATELWNQSLQQLSGNGEAAKAPAKPLGDRRFAAQDWATNPAAAYMAQMYLLNARTARCAR